ncbi:hypothetical protein NADFUDRAFT_52303 [Nadsonia fulvescens var. elongata DSM 6958]|uniref:VPS9 domain-containing protein n=1 Tax=Nadsonia fulvescens var. elongata DSM 6958 TaxID=857566 RepID=A0A1E3PHI6_9ASCO|nr:hypothetical protein NADFUDRAFT_52303 [Nadsonia fulvescens var. elongata DSM 6958]
MALNQFIRTVIDQPPPGIKPFSDALKAGSAGSYALLVPSTFVLTYMADRDLGAYADLCHRDDFCRRHIIQILPPVPSPESSAHRNHQFTTIDGQTVIISEGFVTATLGSNAQHRRLRAKILTDYTYTHPSTGAAISVYELAVPLIDSVSPPVLRKSFLSSPWPDTWSRTPAVTVTHDADGDFKSLLKRHAKIGTLVSAQFDDIIKDLHQSRAATLNEILQEVETALDAAVGVVQSLKPPQIQAMANPAGIDGLTLQKWIHDDLLSRAGPALWSRFRAIYQPESLALQAQLGLVADLNIYQMGIPDLSATRALHLQERVGRSQHNLRQLTSTTDLTAKTSILLSTLEILAQGGRGHADDGADTVVSLLVLVLTQLGSTIDLPAQIAYVKYLTPGGSEKGYTGYVMSTFEGVIGYILSQGDSMTESSRLNRKILDKIITDDDTYMDITKLVSDPLSYYSTNQGNSLLHLAIAHNPQYLLPLLNSNYFDTDFIRYDTNINGESLLLAALHTESPYLINNILLHIRALLTTSQLKEYLQIVDTHGRHIGHYIFKYPMLINLLGRYLSWDTRDAKGQTPLFIICRCYDHPQYAAMIYNSFRQYRLNHKTLNPLRHTDHKGNSLFHIVKSSILLDHILQYHPDVNALNAKSLTPLMVFSRYSSPDIVERIVQDPRVDLHRNGLRGMNVLDITRDTGKLSNIFDYYDIKMHGYSGLSTTHHTINITRSFSLKGEVRFVIATMYQNDRTTLNTVNRNFSDFKFLHKWLNYENDHAWVPWLAMPPNPFLLPSRTPHMMIHDIQRSLNFFIHSILLHPTLATHELVWEFLLIQDLKRDHIVERCRRKLQNTNERSLEKYATVLGDDEIDTIRPFLAYSSESVRNLAIALTEATCALQTVKNKTYDASESYNLLSDCYLSPELHGPDDDSSYKKNDNDEYQNYHPAHLFTDLCRIQSISDFTLVDFLSTLRHLSHSAQSLQNAILLPLRRIDRLQLLRNQLTDHMTNYTALVDKSGFFNSKVLFEEKRQRDREALRDQIFLDQNEVARLSASIQADHEVLAGDIAGFHHAHTTKFMDAVKKFAHGEILAQKERLLRLQQTLNKISELNN